MNLTRPRQVEQYFAVLSLEVVGSSTPAEAFEAALPIAAEVIRQNGIGKAYAVEKLQHIAEAAGLDRHRGSDWVQERLARAFAPVNGHAKAGTKASAPAPTDDHGGGDEQQPVSLRVCPETSGLITEFSEHEAD